MALKRDDRGKFLEPNFQKFWKETIETENMIRVKWHSKFDPFIKRIGYGVKLECTSSDDEEESEDEEPHNLTKPLPSITALFPKPDTPIPSELPWHLPELSYTSTRPVPSKIRSLIYDGISKEGPLGKGRIQYLRYRKKLGPEDKYYHPVASSWDYGWTYGKPQELEKPEHCRYHIVKQTFYRRNGTQLIPRDK